MTTLDDLRRWMDEIAALPPQPRCIMASHLVPYGKAYRQWNTRGEFVIWANRGEIADLPRARNGYGIDIAISRVAPAGMLGIPVVNA